MVGISGLNLVAKDLKSLPKTVKTAEKTVQKVVSNATNTVYPTAQISVPYSNIAERVGYDGAFGESAFDAIRAHMYPQIFENYEVGAGIVKGKTNKIFEALKNLNEQFSKPGKEIRLAPLYDNSLRGRNIVTMPVEAMEQVKQQGIQRVIDLRAEASVSSNRLTIKDGKKYVDGLEYIHIPMNYGSGKEDLDTMKLLPQFFDAMNKGNVYIGCNLGSHRTDFALGLNYALNTATKEASPILYLPVTKVTEGIRRVYKKLMTLSPADRKALGLSEEFYAQLPKDKQELNKRLLKIASMTTETK